MDELISVILPIYNVEKYLEKCVDSLINQTYKNIEIILVDDGSPDNCGKICDDFAKKDKRIKVIHKQNGGISSARNAGMKIAKGKYFSFIDSDDLVSLDFYESLFNLIIKYDADISVCDYLKIYSYDFEVPEIKEEILEYTNETFAPLFNLKNHPYPVTAWNKLYKKELFDGIEYTEDKVHEDEGTTYKVCDRAKKIVYTNRQLYYYNQFNNSSFMHVFNKKRLDLFYQLGERAKLYKTKDEKLYFDTVAFILHRIRTTYIFALAGNADKEILKIINDTFKEYYTILKTYKGKYDVSLSDKVSNFCFYYCKPLFILRNLHRIIRNKF